VKLLRIISVSLDVTVQPFIRLLGRYILIEFGVPMKLVRLIKMCLSETYSEVHIGKHLSDNFPIQNGLRQGDAFSPLLWNMSVGRSRKTKWDWNEMDTSASGLC
jgi:hypothetical protein